ncbi:MAG: hypothetical protein ACLQJL_08040 [Roseiarcus sp.]
MMQMIERFPIPFSPDGFGDRGRPPRRGAGGACAAGDYLKQFHEIAAMIELMDRLPDLADDIGRWGARSGGPFAAIAEQRRDEILGVFDGFNPLMRRAFEAVAAGLVELAQSAAALCARRRQPLTPDQLAACAAIGRSMRRLLERAAALLECANGRRSGALLAYGADFLRRQPANWLAEPANGAN